jgi:hypothetical protein
MLLVEVIYEDIDARLDSRHSVCWHWPLLSVLFASCLENMFYSLRLFYNRRMLFVFFVYVTFKAKWENGSLKKDEAKWRCWGRYTERKGNYREKGKRCLLACWINDHVKHEMRSKSLCENWKCREKWELCTIGYIQIFFVALVNPKQVKVSENWLHPPFAVAPSIEELHFHPDSLPAQ